jgi:GAF domain-containing protein
MTIFTCTIPFQEGKVRSLLQQCSLGTHPWVTIVNQSSFFVGAESITGRAVMGCKPVVIQQRQAENGASPHWDAYTVSAAAHSIRRGERVAGVLFVASAEEHFFTPDRLKVLRDYCHLLVLAFDEEELYPQEQLALGVMPPMLVQQNYLAQVLKCTNGSTPTLLGERLALRSKVERGLIHQIETDLLAMAAHY